MRSICQANEELDKKLKQKQYVKDLEEQIRLRDKIKNEEESKRNVMLDSYQPELDIMKTDPEPVQSPARQSEQEV